MRLAAASVVMFGHDNLIDWPGSGKIAVDVFFALSGWLIGGILINTKREGLPRFYFNRAIRIWVPYLLTLLLIVIASLMKEPITDKWVEFIIYKLTFVYNIFGTPQIGEFKAAMPLEGTGNHFWSINAEEQFYLLAPILLVVVSRYGRNIALWAMLAVGAWYMHKYAPIYLGVLAALIVDKYGDFHKTAVARMILVGTVIVSFTGFIYGTDYRDYSPAFSIALVLLLAIPGKENPVGKFLGGISYPLYLNHWIGVFIANALFKLLSIPHSIVTIILAVILGYLIAIVLYIAIDRPLLSRRGILFTTHRAKFAMFTGYALVSIGILYGLSINSL